MESKAKMRVIRDKLTKGTKKEKKSDRVYKTLDIEHTKKLKKLEEEKQESASLAERKARLEERIRGGGSLEEVARWKEEVEDIGIELHRRNDDEIQYFDATKDIICEYYSKNRKTRKMQLMREYSDLMENIVTVKLSESCVECEGYLETTPCGSTNICTECGVVNHMEYETDMNKSKDVSKKMSTYPYKRINHFIEWLNNITGNETTVISDEIVLQVHQELKKRRILDKNDINRKVIRNILKHLGLNKYYEHTSYIEYKLTDKPLPKITKEQKQVFLWMFKTIQEPFERHKPAGRKNFLSYSYVLHKFCELKMYDYLLGHFELLKNRKKLREQDKTWKLICKDVNWKFYPSC